MKASGLFVPSEAKGAVAKTRLDPTNGSHPPVQLAGWPVLAARLLGSEGPPPATESNFLQAGMKVRHCLEIIRSDNAQPAFYIDGSS